jgi:hypothetical protein
MAKVKSQKQSQSVTVSEFISTDGVSKVSKVKAYFVLGDWSRVIRLGNATLTSQNMTESEVDLILAYIAAALVQKDEIEQSRQVLKRIKNIDEIKSELASLLVSNCYETFGRIRLLMPDTKEDAAYFKKSADALGVSDSDLAARFRYMNACFDFGQSNDVTAALSNEFEQHPRADKTLQEARLKSLVSKQTKLSNMVSNATVLVNNEKEDKKNTESLISLIEQQRKPTVLIAGMRHCGSTALFNLIRLALNNLGYSLFSGYSEKITIDDLKNHEEDCALIKTHEIRDDLEELADIIICPVRDIRDTVASAKRREFPMLKRLGTVDYAKHNRLLNQTWEALQDHCFHYETFIKSPEEEVKKLYGFLNVPESLVSKVVKEVNELPTDKYNETLLSDTHITDKNRELTYFDTLTASEIKQITQHNLRWLKKYGYEQ